MYHTPEKIETKHNEKYEINEFIKWLEECRDKGATHFLHKKQDDPSWSTDLFICQKELTRLEEAKLDLEEAKEEVKNLENRIKQQYSIKQ